MALVVQKDPSSIIVSVGSIWFGNPRKTVNLTNLPTVKVDDLYVDDVDHSVSRNSYLLSVDGKKFQKEIDQSLYKNRYISTLLFSPYSVEDVPTQASPFVGFINFGLPLKVDLINSIIINVKINNNYATVEFFTDLVNEFEYHSAKGYNQGHDNVVTNGESGLYNQFKTYPNYRISKDYNQKRMEKTDISLVSHSTYESNGEISIITSSGSNITKSFNNSIYLRDLYIDYRLHDLLTIGSSINTTGLMPSSFSPLNKSDLFKYTYLTVCHPLGLVPYTIVPISQNSDELTEYYIVIGGSCNCRFNRVYHVSGLRWRITELSMYQKPFIYFYFDSLVVCINNQLYLITPSDEHLSESYLGIEERKDPLMRAHYYHTNYTKLNDDSVPFILVPEFYDLLRYEYWIDSGGYVGISSHVNNGFQKNIYTNKQVGNLSYIDFINSSDKYLVDSTGGMNHWGAINSLMAGYIHLYRQHEFYDVDVKKFLSYDNFLLDKDELLIYPYSYKINKSEPIELDKESEGVPLSYIESTGNRIAMHFISNNLDKVSYYYVDGTYISSIIVDTSKELLLNFRGVKLRVSNNDIQVEE